ncbi:hypothetical protein RvY_14033 [Ramazzottius varieornatus]|uniref:Uncharacterized protein n=1 Tax=Ramazzottius varieornatus TaxID=947166 RepID=A0A1D1VV24_RAMVA|nr:hypothetical protein RvY_14033 [Ramazzottius varieornatus]
MVNELSGRYRYCLRRKDADNIHVVAITSLLKVKVRIEYMDRGQKVSAHDFPEVEGDPQITLLYRPGHYDVLYRMSHEAQ